MTYQDAETVAPALMSVAQAARALKVKEVHAAQATLRDGLLREMAMRDHRSAGFEEQVIYSAQTLAARYGSTRRTRGTWRRARSRCSTNWKEEHQLGGHERLLLRCARRSCTTPACS